MVRDESLRILLIEDNPGDARLIREMFHEASDSQTPLAHDNTGHGDTTPDLLHEDCLSSGLDTLTVEEIDIVLLDLNLPDSRGLDTLVTFRNEAPSVPILVLTGLADRKTGIQALKQGAEEFLVKDEINGQLLVRSVHHAIERAEFERELEQQRDQLAALNRLNSIIRDINHALVEQSTRQDIERIACERLASPDAYLCAWISEVNPWTRRFTPVYEAGIDGCLDGLPLTSGTSQHEGEPIWDAVESEQMQVFDDLRNDSQHEAWCDHAREFGYHSLAIIPIVYEERIYGVLSLHANEPNAFDGAKREVIAELGEILGHAITAVERKEALIAEEIYELRFRIETLDEPILEPFQKTSGQITIERSIPLENGSTLQYCTINGVSSESSEEFTNVLEESPAIQSVRVLDQNDDGGRVQIETTEASLTSLFATYGGCLRHTTIEDGAAHFIAEFPIQTDIGSVLSAVRSELPDIDLVSKETVEERKTTPTELTTAVEEELTDRQRTVLETAFYAGYWDWPRDSTAEEVAESLGIARPTFQEHLRAAQRKLLGTIFEESPPSQRTTFSEERP